MIWERSIDWHETGDARFPWKAAVDGKTCSVRVNEFPAEEFVYTLVVDGEVAFGFNEWPRSWLRPQIAIRSAVDRPPAEVDQHEKASFDLETKWTRRAGRIKPSDKID